MFAIMFGTAGTAFVSGISTQLGAFAGEGIGTRISLFPLAERKGPGTFTEPRQRAYSSVVTAHRRPTNAMSLSTTAAAQECTSLLSPSLLNLSFSFLIFFGILVSYLPQHHRIISRGTSEGISPLFLFLGVTSGTCSFFNILILSWGVLGCCGKGIGGFNCFAASMGVAQVGLQWCCFAVILVLFLIYFPRGGQLDVPGTASRTPSSKVAVTITIASIAHFIAMASATFYISLLHSGSTQQDPNKPPQPSHALVAWANFLGVQSTVLASVQYIPQLYTTWKLKHVGSLSIPMMCIQTPGSFVWAVSLATREGTKWSSWATYVVTGLLQGGLLAMCITWELAERTARKKIGQSIGSIEHPNSEHNISRPIERGDERQPLLSS